MAMLDEQQVKEKVLRYEGFISDVLQRDLQKVLEQRDEVYEKIAQYLQLKSVIERLQETGNRELVTQVDLGCNFYVNAEVTAETLTTDSAKIKANIRMVLEGLRELQGFQDISEEN
ncbi:protein UXT [Sphaerodactylus townsendi]|uniref:protein UXT n=1 Tax=Sphaerodactylus townsendi TaxID=933632 RepID=UPI0020263A32|nr:protein UXT [Sphaerodactylus townsendi]XP_048346016.1 protein UXT [Sphaerodactylus townsendi]XP_048346017.1 protein UXT [Sphaerodactylus townsendi]